MIDGQIYCDRFYFASAETRRPLINMSLMFFSLTAFAKAVRLRIPYSGRPVAYIYKLLGTIPIFD